MTADCRDEGSVVSGGHVSLLTTSMGLVVSVILDQWCQCQLSLTCTFRASCISERLTRGKVAFPFKATGSTNCSWRGPARELTKGSREGGGLAVGSTELSPHLADDGSARWQQSIHRP